MCPSPTVYLSSIVFCPLKSGDVFNVSHISFAFIPVVSIPLCCSTVRIPFGKPSSFTIVLIFPSPTVSLLIGCFLPEPPSFYQH